MDNLALFRRYARLGSEAAWHQGWRAIAFIEDEKKNMEDFNEDDAITFLAGEVKEYLHRKTLVDRIRVARYFTPKRYMALSQPSFHQARACIVCSFHGVTDEKKTDKMVDWCVEHSWPSVDEIRKQKGGKEEEDIIIESAKKACKRVIVKNVGSVDFRNVCEIVANYQIGWEEEPLGVEHEHA